MTTLQGFPRWLSGKESACQCRRLGFKAWVRKIPWRRKWQPTPVFLPGKSHGQRSLAGYSLWGRKESDVTEWLSMCTHNCSTCEAQGSFNLDKEAGAWRRASSCAWAPGSLSQMSRVPFTVLCVNTFHLFLTRSPSAKEQSSCNEWRAHSPWGDPGGKMLCSSVSLDGRLTVIIGEDLDMFSPSE